MLFICIFVVTGPKATISVSILTSDATAPENPHLSNSGDWVVQKSSELPYGETLSLNFATPMLTRYVAVRSEGEGPLVIAEVDVYGMHFNY